MLSKIKGYKDYLISEEKSSSTIHKYIHDITGFVKWLEGREISKELTMEYKQILVEQYTVKTVNSVISSLNSFFIWLGCPECKVKNVRVQKTTFTAPNRDLTMSEYERLLKTAYNLGKERLYLVMQTICATGIRVSELCYITIEAVKNGATQIDCKGKTRSILIPKKLCSMLEKYAAKNNIRKGCIFITRNGRPLDRSNIWAK